MSYYYTSIYVTQPGHNFCVWHLTLRYTYSTVAFTHAPHTPHATTHHGPSGLNATHDRRTRSLRRVSGLVGSCGAPVRYGLAPCVSGASSRAR